MTVSAEFDRAFRLHKEGKLREAFLRYDAIIQTDPTHAGALHFSGVVLHQAGKHVEAIARIRASIGIDPGSPDAWSNLALATSRRTQAQPASEHRSASGSKAYHLGQRPRGTIV